MSDIRILGIDPGNARCGWGIVESQGGYLSLIDCGCVETPKTMEQGDRLCSIFTEVCDLIDRFKPDALSIEKLYFNKNITSAMAVSEARGVIILAASLLKVPVHEYTPMQIKQTLTGKARADKKEVLTMVMINLNLSKKPHPDDTADAVAIALTHIYKSFLI